MSPTATVDSTLSGAVDLARAEAEAEAPGLVGEHLGAVADADRLVTHYFDCLDPAYRGWRWAVTVTRAARARGATVDEVVLVAGEEAVLPPEWVPWNERLRPGDLGVGDLLPTEADDARLAPAAFAEPADEGEEILAWEFGLGRARVLSYDGRMEAVERWWDGPPGPEAPIARSAPATCATCGFWLPLAGPLRQAFGVCANVYAPDDGKVVAVDHGCGGHSEAAIVPPAAKPAAPMLDEVGWEVVGGPVVHEPGSVSDSDADEAVGHS